MKAAVALGAERLVAEKLLIPSECGRYLVLVAPGTVPSCLAYASAISAPANILVPYLLTMYQLHNRVVSFEECCLGVRLQVGARDRQRH